MGLSSVCSTGILRRRYQPIRFDHLRTKYSPPKVPSSNTANWFSDLTDSIKEDWGGKPFVDLRRGWQYILDKYPQVRDSASRAIKRAYLWNTARQGPCRCCWRKLRRIRHQVCLGVDFFRPWLKAFLLAGFKATPTLASDSRLSFVMTGYVGSSGKFRILTHFTTRSLMHTTAGSRPMNSSS